jgi:WD40 repeat protein/serine/threonine protein kinase/tetratricopeptide (TPR) repeat protein
MGVVYRAHQPSLDRPVAVKRLFHVGEPRTEARFAREIHALGQVEHPHLVKVFTSGSDGERWFFAMELIEGATLADVWCSLHDRGGRPEVIDATAWQAAVSTVCDAARRAEKALSGGEAAAPAAAGVASGAARPAALPPSRGGYVRQVVELVRQVAGAAHALHEKNILHRDIKPGNIMVDARGSRAVLMDLGLARVADEEQGRLTRTRQFVGTLRYASPEQVLAVGGLDRRTDVYGLGATLWELLTLRPMFGAGDDTPQAELMRRIQIEEVGRPSAYHRGLSPDLEAIVLRCLEKDARLRYATAQELADDLGRWLNGEPVRARPVSEVERLWKWTRRRPAVAALVASSALCLAVVLALFVSLFYSRELKEKTREAVARRTEAEEQRRKADELFHKVEVEVGQKEAALREAGTQKENAEHQQGIAEAQRREAERQKGKADRALYMNHLNAAQRSLLSGDPRGACEPLDACRWSLRGWEWDHVRRGSLPCRELPVDGPGEFYCFSFSPDGHRLAGSGESGITIWQLPEGRVETTLSAPHEGVVRLRFCPDGDHLLSFGFPEDADVVHADQLVVRTWDVGRRREVGHVALRLPVPLSNGGPWQVSPDGRFFALIWEDDSIGIWDTQTGREVRCGQAKGFAAWEYVRRRELGLIGFDVRLLSSPQPTLDWDCSFRRVFGLCFSPDSTCLAGGLEGNAVCLWDTRTGEELGEVSGSMGEEGLAPGGHVERLAFSPDGHTLATFSSDDSQGRVWFRDLRTGGHPRYLKAELGSRDQLLFSPDGRYVLALGREAELLDCSAALPPRSDPLLGQTEPGEGTPSRRLLLPIEPAWEPLEESCFSPDGHYLAVTAGHPFLVDVRRAAEFLAARVPPDPLGGGSAGLSVDKGYRLSPDGAALVTATGGTLTLESLAQGTRRTLLDDYQLAVHDVAFSADGRVLASLGVRSNHQAQWCSLPSGLYAQTFSVGPPTARELTLWNLTTGQSVAGPLKMPWPPPDQGKTRDGGPPGEPPGIPAPPGVGNTSGAGAVCLSPDGRRLAWADRLTGKLFLWREWPGRASVKLQGHEKLVASLAFSPDGSLLASGDDSGRVKLWDAESGHEVRTLEGPGVPVQLLGFAPDGRLAGGSDRGITLWEPDLSRPLLTLSRRYRTWRQLCWSADSSRLTGLEPSGAVYVWDTRSGEEVLAVEAGRDPIRALCYLPGGRGVRVVTHSGLIEDLDLQPRGDTEVLGEGIANGAEIRFDGEGKYLLLREGDGTARGWDLATGEELEDGVLSTLDLPAPATVPHAQVEATAAAAAPPPELKRVQDPTGHWEARLERGRLALHRLHAPEAGSDPRPLQAEQACRLNWHWREAEAAEGRADWFAARFHLDRLIRPDPERADLHKWRLRLDVKAQDWPRLAEDYLALVACLDSAAWGPWQQLLSLDVQPWVLVCLLDEIERRVAQDPGPWEPWAARAWLQMQRGEWAASVHDFGEAVQRRPGCAPLTWHLVSVAVVGGDRARADAEYPRLAGLVAPAALDVWHRTEYEQARQRTDWVTAHWHLTKLLARPSENTPADYAARAWADLYLQRWQDADDDSRAALERDGTRLGFYEVRTRAALRAGDLAGYRRSCADLLKHFGQTDKPDEKLEVVRYLVLGPEAINDWEPVLRLAEDARRGFPGNGDGDWALGAALYRAGRFAEARARLEEALAHVPEGTPTFLSEFLLALVHHRLGHGCEARRWFARARAWSEEPPREHLRTAAGMVGSAPTSPLTALATLDLLTRGKTGRKVSPLTPLNQLIWDTLAREAEQALDQE